MGTDRGLLWQQRGSGNPEALRPLRLSPRLSQGMSDYRIRAIGVRHRVLAVAAGSTESIRSRLLLVSAGCRASLVHQRLQVEVRLRPTPRGGRLRSWLGGCAFLGHGERSRRSLRSDKTRAPLSISRCSWNWRLGDGIRAPTVRRSALVELPGTRAVARSNSSGPRSEPGALLALDRSVARRGGERLIMGARVQGPNDLVRVEKRQAACG